MASDRNDIALLRSLTLHGPELMRKARAHADISDVASLHDVVKSLHRLCDWRLVVESKSMSHQRCSWTSGL